MPFGKSNRSKKYQDQIIDPTVYLMRYGYLRPRSEDKVTREELIEAYAKFQEFYHMPITKRLNKSMIELMQQPRCGHPDLYPGVIEKNSIQNSDEHQPSILAAGATTQQSGCAWQFTNVLKYSFGNVPGYLIDVDVHAAVRKAFDTWETKLQHVPITFVPAQEGEFADIFIDWRSYKNDAHTGDHLHANEVAHADFPPDCGIFDPPKPMHFEVEDHVWVIGPMSDAHDVEVVALHEIGHIIGLIHRGNQNDVMFPTQGQGRTINTPSADDLVHLRLLYP